MRGYDFNEWYSFHMCGWNLYIKKLQTRDFREVKGGQKDVERRPVDRTKDRIRKRLFNLIPI